MIGEFIKYIEFEKRYSSRTVEIYRDALYSFYSYIYNDRLGESSDPVSSLDQTDLLSVLTYRDIRSYVAYSIGEGLGARTVNLHLSALSR